MTKLQKAERKIRKLKRLLMEAAHILIFAGEGIVNERLKDRIQKQIK
jgi:thiamine pyrophosphate-dependent acetolactate synthase large subunit-like protein